MSKEIILTADGSKSVRDNQTNATYHSVHGAIQESRHVFIEAGLKFFSNKEFLKIFELGLGTGLNALLSFIESEANGRNLFYKAIEPFPLEQNVLDQLDYCSILTQTSCNEFFRKIHSCNWDEPVQVSSHITFRKLKSTLIAFEYSVNDFDVVYFDAFAPSTQPELWDHKSFSKIARMLKPGGILVTYCSKGEVRRTLNEVGFEVKKLPGPPGKREMIRATLRSS